MNEFSKMTKHKINVQKPAEFLYNSNEHMVAEIKTAFENFKI